VRCWRINAAGLGGEAEFPPTAAVPKARRYQMKTTIDIPEKTLREAMRFTKAKTKREAVLKALDEFNRRQRMAELVKYSGSCKDMTGLRS
jgi:hypothetical protein